MDKFTVVRDTNLELIVQGILSPDEVNELAKKYNVTYKRTEPLGEYLGHTVIYYVGLFCYTFKK